MHSPSDVVAVDHAALCARIHKPARESDSLNTTLHAAKLVRGLPYQKKQPRSEQRTDY